MATTVDQPTRMRFTIDHVQALAAAGCFDDAEQVELIGGEIIVTPPPGKQHATVAMRLDAWLQAGTSPSTSYVGKETTLELPSGDLVTADLCVLGCPVTAFVGYPPVEQVALVVEIAMTSQKLDRGDKLERYALAGIPEYWVIDIPTQTVEVHTQPATRRYRRIELYGVEDTIDEVPGAAAPLSVAALFPAGIDWS